MGLVSAGLLVLGATGLYLWFVRKKERKLGIALLVLVWLGVWAQLWRCV